MNRKTKRQNVVPISKKEDYNEVLLEIPFHLRFLSG